MRCFFYLVILVLTACQHNLEDQRQSGKYSHTQKKTNGASYSRYGNPDLYQIAGKKYAVMRSAQGYKARGIASWYGNDFHAKRTSSGDPYDMYAMTAAHKTLPLPSYVRVKNLQNGKAVVVRVNDRGPFRKDRLIDLSYAAASRIGLMSHGTAQVEVEAIAPSGMKSANYFVQAAAYNGQREALHSRDKIKKSVRSLPVFVEKYKQHYVVRLGPILSKRTMEVTKRQLVRMGFKGVYAALG